MCAINCVKFRNSFFIITKISYLADLNLSKISVTSLDIQHDPLLNKRLHRNFGQILLKKNTAEIKSGYVQWCLSSVTYITPWIRLFRQQNLFQKPFYDWPFTDISSERTFSLLSWCISMCNCISYCHMWLVSLTGHLQAIPGRVGFLSSPLEVS